MAESRCPGCGMTKTEFARDTLAATGHGDVDDDLLAQLAGDEPVARAMMHDSDVADGVAALVASWAFPVAVLAAIVVWIGVNVALRPAPFPLLLLAVISAVLASLGALQGPIILRVQRRQRQRDRARDEFDHRVNVRAEIEIRWLDHKLDHVLAARMETPDTHAR